MRIALPIKEPNHRALRVVAAVRTGSRVHNPDVWEEALYRVINAVPDSPFEVLYALAIHQDEMKRELTEALLLADASAADVRETLEIPENVVSVYQHLFFDTNVFYDRVDKLRYANNYPNDIEEGRARVRKLEALQRGLVYLKASLAGPSYKVNPADVARLLMHDAFIFGAQAYRYDIDEALAKEARSWGQTAIRHAATLMTLPDTEAAQQGQQNMVELIRNFKEQSNTAAIGQHGAPVDMKQITGYSPTISSSQSNESDDD